MDEKLISFTLPSFDQSELPTQASSKARILVADDYLVKPFHVEELRARILVGLPAMTSQETLADRVQALETSLFATRSGKLRIPL